MEFLSVYSKADGALVYIGSHDLDELERDLNEAFNEGLILIRCFCRTEEERFSSLYEDRLNRSANA